VLCRDTPLAINSEPRLASPYFVIQALWNLLGREAEFGCTGALNTLQRIPTGGSKRGISNSHQVIIHTMMEELYQWQK
jgi:hypothetical protein